MDYGLVAGYIVAASITLGLAQSMLDKRPVAMMLHGVCLGLLMRAMCLYL